MPVTVVSLLVLPRLPCGFHDPIVSSLVVCLQSYKAMLEKRQKALLAQLEQLHEQQELSVMEMFHNINKTIENIEHGCKSYSSIIRMVPTLCFLYCTDS